MLEEKKLQSPRAKQKWRKLYPQVTQHQQKWVQFRCYENGKPVIDLPLRKESNTKNKIERETIRSVGKASRTTTKHENLRSEGAANSTMGKGARKLTAKERLQQGESNLPVDTARRSPASRRFPATGSDRIPGGGLLRSSRRMERSHQIFIRAVGVNMVICDC